MFSCPQGREAGDVLGFRLDTPAAQFGERCVHVQDVPAHHHGDHQTQRPELVLLPLPVTLADLATLAMEDRRRHTMPSLAPIAELETP
jgi:hypothetical protein